MKIISILSAMVLFLIALRADFKYKNNTMSWWAIIPTIWLSIRLSRNLSRWLNVGKTQMVRNADYVDLLEQGNLADQLFFSALLVISAIILIKRKELLFKIFKENKIWILFILYCMLSILWSEFAFNSLKRFIKDLNSYFMVLLILTENDPFETFKAVVRRCIFLLIPLSIAFCKYFPAIGRYQTASWDFIYTGVATHKNELAVLCLIAVMILFIEIWPYLKNHPDKINRHFLNICWLFFGMSIYLLRLAQSMTTSICMIIFIFVFVSNFLKIHLRKFIIIIAILYLAGIDEYFLNTIAPKFFSIIERNRTFTGRTVLWEAILNLKFNHLIGTGYSAFWLGDRMKELIETFIFVPKQAHNGYIEVYVNLGIIGITIFLTAFYNSYKKITANWSADNYHLSFQLAFIALYLVYNVTEATFVFNASPLWFVFLFIALSNEDEHKKNKTMSSITTKI